MADNFTFTPGDGLIGAADEVAGALYQRIKIAYGADGSATDVSAAAPFPVDTEIPAAIPLIDALANPTTPVIGAAISAFNGSTWDKVRGTIANGIDVDVTRVQGSIDTELPAADVLADATVNPTVPLVGSAAEIFNGTTWDRLKSATAAQNTTGTGLLGAGLLLFDGTNYQRIANVIAATDANAGTGVQAVGKHRYNGATWDRERGNTEGTLLASLQRTTTTVTSSQTNFNARSLIVFLNVTAASGTGGLQMTVKGVDPVSGAAASLNDNPTNITGTGCFYGKIDALPRTWAVEIAHGDGSNYTYSLGYSLVV